MSAYFYADDASVKKELNVILQHITFSLNGGEMLAVVGASGCGKTTLGQLVAGSLPAYTGIVKVMEKVKPLFVDQQDNFFAQSGMSLTYYSQRYEYTEESADIPTVGAWLENLTEDVADKAQIADVFECMHIVPLYSRNLLQLSNGERKRVQIALALLENADLYVFDQPFLGLDTATRELLRNVLQELLKQGKAIVLVCGVMQIPAFANHVMRLKEGTIDAYADTKTFIASLPKKKILDIKPEDLHLPQPEKEVDAMGFVVKMKDIHVTMAGEPILHDISWEVKEHERWLLAGHNGSGKSTLLSLITADNPQAYINDIALFGKPRGSGESIWDIKKKIGFVSPELHLYFLRKTKLTAFKTTSSTTDMNCLNVVISGFHDEIGSVSEATNYQQQMAREWLKTLHLEYLQDKNFSEVSLGEQRMLLLLRALVKNPPLLILDEPCQGVDYEQSQRFVELLDLVCTSLDSTLIYVSHSPDEIPSCITHKIELVDGTVKSIS